MRRFDLADLTAWIELRFDPARGPGGQNVNKVATRATLILDFRACPHFSDPQRERIASLYARRLSRDGRLRIVAQQQRTQTGNRAVAEERLLALLDAALHVPRPRRATRPTAAARRRRVATKKRRGEIKRLRAHTVDRDQ